METTAAKVDQARAKTQVSPGLSLRDTTTKRTTVSQQQQKTRETDKHRKTSVFDANNDIQKYLSGLDKLEEAKEESESSSDSSDNFADLEKTDQAREPNRAIA